MPGTKAYTLRKRAAPSYRTGTRSRLRGSNPYLPKLTSGRTAFRKRFPASRRHRLKSANPMRSFNISPGVGGQTFVKHHFRPDRRAYAIEKVGANNTYSVSAATRLDVLSGYQNSVGFDTAGNDTLKIIMGTIPVTGLATINQYVLKNTLSVLSIANNSTSGCHMDLYDVIYKRSTPREMANVTGTVQANVIANDLWRLGMQDQDVASQANAKDNLLVLPTAARTFNDYCKVVRKRRILLAAGSTHEHRQTLIHNKLVSTDLIGANGFAVGQFGSNQVYLMSGFAMTTLIVCYGNPTSEPTDLGTVVSTAPLAVDIVYQAQYNFTWVNDKQNTTNIQDGLQSFAPGVGQIVAPAFAVGPVQIASP